MKSHYHTDPNQQSWLGVLVGIVLFLGIKRLALVRIF